MDNTTAEKSQSATNEHRAGLRRAASNLQSYTVTRPIMHASDPVFVRTTTYPLDYSSHRR